MNRKRYVAGRRGSGALLLLLLLLLLVACVLGAACDRTASLIEIELHEEGSVLQLTPPDDRECVLVAPVPASLGEVAP